MKEERNTSIYIAHDDAEPYDPAAPEKTLLVAILLTALSDLKKEGDSNRKAMEYFLSPDEEYIFSFRSICNFLNVDAQKVLIVSGLKKQRPAAERGIHVTQ